MFKILMWLRIFSDLIPKGVLSFVLKYIHVPGLLITVKSSLFVIYFYKNHHLLCYLFYIVVICNKFLIFCFYNNSSTYDDNDSGVQDTVLPTPTKQYGSYTDGKHPTHP